MRIVFRARAHATRQYYTIRETHKTSTFATQLQNFYLENLWQFQAQLSTVALWNQRSKSRCRKDGTYDGWNPGRGAIYWWVLWLEQPKTLAVSFRSTLLISSPLSHCYRLVFGFLFVFDKPFAIVAPRHSFSLTFSWARLKTQARHYCHLRRKNLVPLLPKAVAAR